MFKVWMVDESEPHKVTGSECQVVDGHLWISEFSDVTTLSVCAAGTWRVAVRDPQVNGADNG